MLSLGLLEAAKKYNDEKNAKTDDSGASAELVAYIEEKIEARRAAKAAKNFAEADAIRMELAERGITLIDTREGTKFKIEA